MSGERIINEYAGEDGILYQVFGTRDLYERALATASNAIRIETIAALRAPHRKLVTLLRMRAADLNELDQIVEEHLENSDLPGWGMF